MPLVDYQKHRGTVVHVDLAAPPHLRWKEAVEEWGDEVHAMFADVVEYCEEEEPWLDSLPRTLGAIVRAGMKPSVSLAGRVVSWVANLYGQEYVDEVKGLAKFTGISFPQALLGNLMYDITQHAASSAAHACSSFSCNIDGVPVLARNMDWAWPPTIGKYTQLVHFHRGKRGYTAVGVIGMVGVLSAIYPVKWAVTLNQAPVNELGFRYIAWPALQWLRASCDRFGNFNQLVTRLQGYQTMSPFFLHVVGVNPDEHVIVNAMGADFEERAIEGEFLVQTNHFVDEHLQRHNDTDSYTDDDGIEWMMDTKPRYQALVRRLRKGLPESIKDAQAKLRRSPVTNENTMQSMAMCAATGDLVLKVFAK